MTITKKATTIQVTIVKLLCDFCQLDVMSSNAGRLPPCHFVHTTPDGANRCEGQSDGWAPIRPEMPSAKGRRRWRPANIQWEAGHDGRAPAVAVVEHFRQVAPVCVVKHRPPPINHEQVYLGQLLEQLAIAGVRPAYPHSGARSRCPRYSRPPRCAPGMYAAIGVWRPLKALTE